LAGKGQQPTETMPACQAIETGPPLQRRSAGAPARFACLGPGPHGFDGVADRLGSLQSRSRLPHKPPEWA